MTLVEHVAQLRARRARLQQSVLNMEAKRRLNAPDDVVTAFCTQEIAKHTAELVTIEADFAACGIAAQP